jgi:hypothetical protein
MLKKLDAICLRHCQFPLFQRMHSFNFISEFEPGCANFSAMSNKKSVIGDLQQTIDTHDDRPRDGLRSGRRLLSLL